MKSYTGLYLVLLTLLTGCMDQEVVMSCSGLLSISDMNNHKTQSPHQMKVVIKTKDDPNKLQKEITSISVGGTKFTICEQTDKEIKFLEDCKKNSSQPISGYSDVNNVTDENTFNKIESKLTMNSIYRLGNMFVTDKNFYLICK